MKSIEQSEVDYMIGVTQRKEVHRTVFAALIALAVLCAVVSMPANSQQALSEADAQAPSAADAPAQEADALAVTPSTKAIAPPGENKESSDIAAALADIKASLTEFAARLGFEADTNKDQEKRIAALEAKVSELDKKGNTATAGPALKQAGTMKSSKKRNNKIASQAVKTARSTSAMPDYSIRGIAEHVVLIQDKNTAQIKQYIVGDTVDGIGLISQIDPDQKMVVAGKSELR